MTTASECGELMILTARPFKFVVVEESRILTPLKSELYVSCLKFHLDYCQGLGIRQLNCGTLDLDSACTPLLTTVQMCMVLPFTLRNHSYSHHVPEIHHLEHSALKVSFKRWNLISLLRKTSLNLVRPCLPQLRQYLRQRDSINFAASKQSRW